MNTTKITAKVYEPLADKFNKLLDENCLKRDAFFNRILSVETRYLGLELSQMKQSNAARRYIATELKNMGCKTISMVVDVTVADQLNGIVEETNMVRDAFINRLLLLLLLPQNILKRLGLPNHIPTEVEASDGSYVLNMPALSPLLGISNILNEPLYYIREILEINQEGIYQVDLGSKLIGFSCYLDDQQVPGTREYKKAEKRSDELLKDLANL